MTAATETHEFAYVCRGFGGTYGKPINPRNATCRTVQISGYGPLAEWRDNPRNTFNTNTVWLDLETCDFANAGKLSIRGPMVSAEAERLHESGKLDFSHEFYGAGSLGYVNAIDFAWIAAERGFRVWIGEFPPDSWLEENNRIAESIGNR